ncbi:MAG: mucoidy inhibitor MuiA family protein [Cocleimonas sp.]
MIKVFISVIAASAFLVSAAQAGEIKTSSTIEAVTIYPSSAKVVRVATIQLEAGDNDVIINNLPLNLNETSLRVSGEGQGTMSLGSVELLRNFQEDVVQEREKQIRDKIEELQDGRREIQDALLRSRKQFEYIQRMALGNNNVKTKNITHDSGHNNEGSYKNLPLEKWQEAWQTLDSATATVQERTRIAEKSLKTYDKQIKKLSRDLQQVAVNQRETRTAKLHVKSEAATALTLKLTYQIHGARWAPVYDADLNTSTGKMELKTLAQISQRTGEDWKGVAVTLSTLRPSAGTQLPQLNPWVLDFMPDLPPPVAMSQNRMYKKKSMRMESMADSGAMNEAMVTAAAPKARPMKRMVQVQSQLVSTDFSAEYKVPNVVSLDSGSNKRRFALTSQNFDAEVRLASAPRQDPRAMILAKAQHTGDTPLLAGSLSLYRNGSFVGNTFLQQKLSGEELKLSFGEDDKVKIKFLPDPDKKRKDGLLFGKKKVVERHYQLSINSNHDKPFEISLYDVLPVAANEDIKVKLLGDAPTKKDLEDKKGVVSWERTLQPKQDTKLKYGYSVSYPEDKIVPAL